MGRRFAVNTLRENCPRFGVAQKTIVFRVAVLIAMLAPLATFGAQTALGQSPFWQPVWSVVPLMALLGDSHAFATAYLYTQPGSFQGVPNRLALLVIVPAALIIFSIYAMTLMPSSALLWVMVVYVHYALFHFARQNIGLLSFVTLTSKRRSLQPVERGILNGVALCGMFGALKLYAPNLLLNPVRLPLDLSPITGAIPVLYDIGFGLYAVVLVCAVYRFLRCRADYDLYSAVIFWLCVLWYLPIYATLRYPLLSVAAFTMAHGLQYLIFLALHAYRQSHRRVVRAHGAGVPSAHAPVIALVIAAVPFILFGATILTGGILLRHSTGLFGIFSSPLTELLGVGAAAKTGAGLVLGLTLSHFWVDQFIWRFGSPARRAWLFENFPFLLGDRADPALAWTA
jgi:hypothetical protein